MNEVKISQASITDSQAIHDCFDAAFRPFATTIVGFPDVTHGLLEAIKNGEVFVAKEGDLIFGAITLMQGKGFVKIGILAVDPAQKGRGLGREMVAFAEEYTRALGITEMRLRTHVLMPQNVELYKHLGWQVTDQDEMAVSMSRHL